MSVAQTISGGFWRWLDEVAEAMIAAIARLTAPRRIRLVEGERGQFAVDASASASAAARGQFRIEDGKVVGLPPATPDTLQRGRVELVLRPDRFLFKPLELPSRAGEFLDGVVRAQIDRLTPWSADQAAFGFTKPSDAGAGRIAVTVAATAKAVIAPYLQAFTAAKVRSLTISTYSPEAPGAPAIKILEQTVAGISIRQARRFLLAILAVTILLAAGAFAAATIIDSGLQTRQDEVARRIAARRAAAIAARNTPENPATVAERALARRKNETPSSVIVLEVLSKVLPDHTYVTELRIEGSKLRLTGVTRDAPSLIRLIEQSRHFNGAVFFAPTTRAPAETGDRFSIEARIEAVFAP